MAQLCLSIIAEIARWTYFVLALLSLMNGFIHIHIQLEMAQCPDAVIQYYVQMGTNPTSTTNTINSALTCIGRNVAWREDEEFNYDTNKLLWRTVFTFQPEIFFDIWLPIIISTLAVVQHFRPLRWDMISRDWGRCFLFIVVWQLFCVVGYGSNFGVMIGFTGCIAVGSLYFIICLLLIFGCADVDIRDHPTLELQDYLSFCSAKLGSQLKRKHSDVKSINHDNDSEDDEQQTLAPMMRKNQQTEEMTNVHALRAVPMQKQYTNDASSYSEKIAMPGTMTKTIGNGSGKYNQIDQNGNSSSGEMEDDIDNDHNGKQSSNHLRPPAVPGSGLPPPVPADALPETNGKSDYEVSSDDGDQMYAPGNTKQ